MTFTVRFQLLFLFVSLFLSFFLFYFYIFYLHIYQLNSKLYYIFLPIFPSFFFLSFFLSFFFSFFLSFFLLWSFLGQLCRSFVWEISSTISCEADNNTSSMGRGRSKLSQGEIMRGERTINLAIFKLRGRQARSNTYSFKAS